MRNRIQKKGEEMGEKRNYNSINTRSTSQTAPPGRRDKEVELLKQLISIQ